MGRLSDGRAFRTDAEGNQLVDYIAELEVSVEAFRTQVRGLEEELQEKQASIDRLKQGASVEATIAERDLVAATPEKAADAPGVATIVAASDSCASSEEQVAQLQLAMGEVRADLELERALASKKTEEAERTRKDLETKLIARDETLESLRTDYQTAEVKIASLNEELAGVRSQLLLATENATRERQGAPVQMASAERILRPKVLPLLSEEETEARPTMQERSPRAGISVAGVGGNEVARLLQPSESDGSETSSLSTARARAVEVVRGKVRLELSQLKGLIAGRDQAVQRYRSKPQVVSFKPQPAVSAEGSSVAQLEERLEAVVSVSDAAKIGREASQIRAKMNEDIALIKRMDRSR
jgi:hypothetical protein